MPIAAPLPQILETLPAQCGKASARLFVVKTERDHKDAPITRSITREIQSAFRGIGASELEVARILDMSSEELCDLGRKLKADPYLQAYIRFWGDALPDEEILYFLRRWNSGMGAA
jgi:hypothetical protein